MQTTQYTVVSSSVSHSPCTQAHNSLLLHHWFLRMHTFSSLLAISLLAALVHAGAPELHEFGRRDNVCALNLRGAIAKDCLVDNKGTFFTLTPPSTITATAVTVGCVKISLVEHLKLSVVECRSSLRIVNAVMVIIFAPLQRLTNFSRFTDHIVELQLLDGALKKSGVCDMITDMIKARSSVSKAALLQPLSDIINGNKNLKFLASSVNNRVR